MSTRQIAAQEWVPPLLSALDALAEERGWDGPADLFGVFEDRIGSQSVARFSPFPGWIPAYALHEHPFRAAQGLARGLKVAPAFLRPKLPGLVAVALVFEAWALPKGTPQPVRSPGEVPGAVEQRQVILVAQDGSTAVLTRTKGQDPVLASEDYTGRLTVALTSILITAQDR